MKAYLLIGLIALFVLLSGCVEVPPADDQELKAIDECYEMSNDDAIDQCLSGVFENSTNPEICKNLEERILRVGETLVSKENFRKDKCYSEIALNRKEIELCNEVEDYIARFWCGNEVILGTSRSFRRSVEGTNEPKDCLKLENETERIECLYDIATALENVEICDMISKPEKKEECQWAIYGEDHPGCETVKYSERIRNACYASEALRERDVSICENVTNTTNLKNWRESCIMNVAKDLDDETLCELAANPERNDEDKYNCYMYFAIDRLDFSLCNKLLASSHRYFNRDVCLTEIAYQLGDSSKCEDVTESSSRDYCYYLFAKKENDVQLCNKIEDIDNQILCDAEISEDETKCEEIQEEETMDSCYFTLAVVTLNQELCPKIKNETLKGLCELKFKYG